VSSALPRLHLNRISGLDWLIALEFGRVDDGQAADCWRGVGEDFGYLLDSPDGRIVGFKVQNYSRFDPEDPEVSEIWTLARFEVPLLGLHAASAGEIVLAARPLLGEDDTINRLYFDAAVATDDSEKALSLWLACLQAGDSMAHFGLGYTLFDLGRHHEAYRHLRHYAEIAPAGAWNWCWLGRAAEAIGEVAEAREAYERAIALSEEGDYDTDAAELLAALARRHAQETST
jgi:tetratricopeptide (TPR) repeat protein